MQDQQTCSRALFEFELKHLASHFGIDLLCYAILTSHFHLVLRSRPDAVSQWDDSQVARHWLLLCPMRRDADRSPEEPNEYELNMIRNNPAKLKDIRSRLSDISWWMRLLSQKIAQRANQDDKEVGKFWQARYRAVRLLDETALLACAAYVDLNSIRAAMAQTIEQSDFTSAQQRFFQLKSKLHSNVASNEQSMSPFEEPAPLPALQEQDVAPKRDAAVISDVDATSSAETIAKSTVKEIAKSLCPLSIDELRDEVGACVQSGGYRASDKGFLPMSEGAYLELLDWTARQRKLDKRGATPECVRPIFERLIVSAEVWFELTEDFGRLFATVAG